MTGTWITLMMGLEYLMISSSYSAAREVSYSTNDENDLKFRRCKEPWCEEYSPYEILHMFRGIFFTEEEMEDEQQMFERSRSKYLRKQGVKDVDKLLRQEGDGDACCVTIKRKKMPNTLENTRGDERLIVHLASSLPPSFQLIPFGECENEKGESSCGECVMEYVITKLLVFDPNLKVLLFDQFELPAYCSCKRTFSNSLI